MGRCGWLGGGDVVFLLRRSALVAGQIWLVPGRARCERQDLSDERGKHLGLG